MCIHPSNVWVQRGPNYEQIPVPCRKCWRCKQNRVNDYVARAMAETSVSAHTCTITLTYAPRDDLADKILQPRHFQLFMKLLRRSGHSVRYLVAGEYGTLKDRAHFHALLFFQYVAPGNGITPAYGTHDAAFCRDIPHKRMVHIREWPHGHITADWSGTEKSARYVCKYLLADDKNSAWFSLSKKPALGAEWFARKAQAALIHDVLPSTFEYLPPGGSKDRPYLLTGASRRDYLNAICVDPAKRERMSEWVQKSFDKYRKDELKAWCDAAPPEYVLGKMLENLSIQEAVTDRVLESQRVRELWQSHYGYDITDWTADQLGIENNEQAWFDYFQTGEGADRLAHLTGTHRPSGQHVSCCACASCAGGGTPVHYLSGEAQGET